jgi:sulfur carrier protein ThiS
MLVEVELTTGNGRSIKWKRQQQSLSNLLQSILLLLSLLVLSVNGSTIGNVTLVGLLDTRYALVWFG